ncbi:MAG: WecB/TagA/CpsF family glycosyltransferase [Candidatus Shapirobacteria bacterium]|nr:WecB/TagA/CpsF family glycosyltransferase [Candidatus Shapirobacteria bacterium]
MKKKRLKKQSAEDKLEVKFVGVDDSFFLSYWKIFDISLFGRQRSDLLNIIGRNLDSGTKKYWIATVNPEFVMAAEKDRIFKDILKKTSLNVVDGIGLVWTHELDIRSEGRRNLITAFNVGMDVLKGKYKDQMASGADLILELARMAKEKNKKIFLLGGWQDRAERTAGFLKKKFGLKDSQLEWCVGEPEISNEEVLKQINQFKPDILLVAYGMKKQEFWINDNLQKLDVGLVMGVGRSFDYYSGDLKRAPEGLRKMGMEWFYSLVKEPKRFKRQLALPKFIWKVLREK